MKTPERRAKELYGLGVRWEDPDEVREENWNSSFGAVVAFQKEHGKLPFCHSKDPAEAKLGRWCGHQREAYKGKGKRKLSLERSVVGIIGGSQVISERAWITLYPLKRPG
jgi:hypothetical protein